MSPHDREGDGERHQQHRRPRRSSRRRHADRNPANEEQHPSNALPMWKDSQWWQVFVAAILVPFGIYAVIVYSGQLEEMRKATEAATEANQRARQVMHLEQRAWIAVSGISSVVEVGKPLLVNVVMVNTGRTFGTNVEIRARAETPPVIVGTPTEPYGTNIDKSVPIMPPNIPFTTTVGAEREQHIVTQEDMDHIKTTNPLFFRCKITYDDVFGCGHWTSVCVRFDPADNGWRACDTQNDAGDKPCAESPSSK